MRSTLDVATDPWGIKVNRVELKNIMCPPDIQGAMEKQAKAERERRAAVTSAEGEKKAAILVAEGKKESTILEAEAEKAAQILRAEAKKEATIREAEGQAQAILAVQKAFGRAADGKATKIISPSEIQGLAGLVSGITEVASEAKKQVEA